LNHNRHISQTKKCGFSANLTLKGLNIAAPGSTRGKMAQNVKALHLESLGMASGHEWSAMDEPVNPTYPGNQNSYR